MRRRELIVASGGAALLGSGVASAASAPAANTSLDARLQQLLTDERFPLAGLSVLQMRSGKVVHEGFFGQRRFKDERAPDLPVTRDTLFRVASISKLITGLGALRLAEMGKLDLDADIGDVLGRTVRNPKFPQDVIHVRDLLSHISSLRDDGGIAFAPGVSLLDHLSRTPKCWSDEHPPGWFAYCNLGYGLLATVMEKAGGKRFDLLMQELVIAPLGMQGGFNGMSFDEVESANVATLYRKQRIVGEGKEGKEVWDASAPWAVQADDWRAEPPKDPEGLDAYAIGSNGTVFGPQGRLRTRVCDLGTVMAMLMSGGLHKGQRFLRKASLDRMFSERWRHDMALGNGDNFGGEFLAWGIGAQHFIDKSGPGWGDRLIEKGGLQAWGHLGFAYGLQAGFMLDASRQHGIVYVMSGHAADPSRNRGRYSSFSAWEERLHELLWSSLLA